MSAITRRRSSAAEASPSRDFLHHQWRYIDVIPQAVVVPPFRGDCLVGGNDKIAARPRLEIADDRGFDVNRLIHPSKYIACTRPCELTTQAQPTDKPRSGLSVGWSALLGDLHSGQQPAIMARTPPKPTSGVWYRSGRLRKCSCSGTASGSISSQATRGLGRTLVKSRCILRPHLTVRRSRTLSF